MKSSCSACRPAGAGRCGRSCRDGGQYRHRAGPRALRRLGLAAQGQLTEAERPALVALLAKAEPSTTGLLRGRRHTMLDDSDISATRHARAFVAGALSGLVGHAEIFVSGGAEHQGPDGGGPVAVIVDRSKLN